MRILSIMALFAFVGAAGAEEKKLSGSWKKKGDGFDLTLTFVKADLLQFAFSDGTNGCTLEAKYTVEKDGTLKCEITKFEKMGNFPVERDKGYKFSFKSEIKDKVATISNFEGNDIDDEARMVVEGDYEKTTD